MCQVTPHASTFYHVAVNLLQPLIERCQQECGIKLVLLAKPKAEDGSVQIQQLISSIQSDPLAQGSPIPVGHLPKDKHEGKVAELFNQVGKREANK